MHACIPSSCFFFSKAVETGIRDFRPKNFFSILPTKTTEEENLTLKKENKGSFMNF